MLETKEQKQYFGTVIVLIIILGLISFWHTPKFNYQNTTDYQSVADSYNKKQEAYNKYLASLSTTPQTQEAFLKEILPEAVVKQAIEEQLNVNQKITVPVIADGEIKISNATGKTAVLQYLNLASPVIEEIKNNTDMAVNDIYNLEGDKNKVTLLEQKLLENINKFENISVPKEAVNFHKQILVGLNSYLDIVKSSEQYVLGLNKNPWDLMYKNYSIILQSNELAETEFNNLSTKYQLALQDQSTSNNWFIPVAKAQLATIDVWAKAKEALDEVVATAVARFMLAFLDKLANKIEEAYRVSNFLYYTDALVSGQYADDYLNKYVNDALDRTIIRNFIPQIGCGNGTDYAAVFEAKANSYLGFDPASLNPDDPYYYQKLARVGNFLSQPGGWAIYYKDIATQAQAAAEKAAGLELSSPGQKAARDIIGDIITPVSVSVSSLQAIFTRYLLEGRADQKSTLVEKITSQITQTFLNNFVFKGVVYQEQKTCIPIPQVKLLTGVALQPGP